MPYTKYHPVFLDLNDKPVLVVGGGAVALEKLNSLLPASGARITVVAPEAREEIEDWSLGGRLAWERRDFQESDVESAFMVIAATDDPALNAWVFHCGSRRHRLTNSVDDPEHCNFIMAALTGKAPIQIAVSSSGCSPALAQRIRDRIASEILEDGTSGLAEFLGDWRPQVKASLPTYRHRQAFWERVIDSSIPEVLVTQGREAADHAMAEALKQELVEC